MHFLFAVNVETFWNTRANVRETNELLGGCLMVRNDVTDWNGRSLIDRVISFGF